MRTLLAATVGPFLRQTNKSSLSPVHLLTLALSLIQTLSILFVPSSPSSGNNSFALIVNTVSSTHTPPTPTTKIPTRTTPTIIVENSDTFGIYLSLGIPLVCIFLGLATVYSRAGRETTDSNCSPPHNPRSGQSSAPSPPPTNDTTENDDTEGETDNGESDPDDSGNECFGNGDGDDDDSNDVTDDQEVNDSPSEGLLCDEPDPEDPPPPPPTTLNENDDNRKVIIYGPALSLLYFLLGAVTGLLTRLVTMNATRYCRELQRLCRNIASGSISMQLGSFKYKLSGPSTVGILHSCHHQPFVVATAQPRSSPRPRRMRVSLPAPFAKVVFTYIPDAIVSLSRTYIHLLDTVRPSVNWLMNAMAEDLLVVEVAISLAIDKIRAVDIEYGPYLHLVNTIRLWINQLISGMAEDLVVVEAATSLGIDKIRAVDIEYGSSLRLIAGCTILVLVVLEVYHTEVPVKYANAPNAAAAAAASSYGDEIMFPFANVDLPFEESNFHQPNTAHVDPTGRSEDNSPIFPFHDVDLPIVEVKTDAFSTVHASIMDPIANFEFNNGAIAIDEIEVTITEPKVAQLVKAIEEVSMDCTPALSSGSMDVEQVEFPEAGQDNHETNDTVTDNIAPSTFNEDFSSYTDTNILTEDEKIPTRMPRGENSYTENQPSVEEDPSEVLYCLAGLFDSSTTDQSLLEEECPFANTSGTKHEEITVRTPTCEDEAGVEQDPDTILECLADFFDSPLNRGSFTEESAFSSSVQNEVVSIPVSPHRVSGSVCIRAFTSCEAFAAMFGFENEKPLEFLRPLPARLERLLPPYFIFPSTPARYFTLGAPPATPTTPYTRWVEEKHQNTPFVPSPFSSPPRTPPHTPPTIVIPSPTSSEGTQAPDESPSSIRARRLDRKWAKMMAKRQRNEARNVVPHVQIEETSFSSSLASDTSIRSFFDPHASINRGVREAETEAGPSKLMKWKPRSPGDPAPRQRRRWRERDVLVGAGEDENYGAVMPSR